MAGFSEGLYAFARRVADLAGLDLDPRDPDTLEIILQQLDNAIQYHDDIEPRAQDERDEAAEAGEHAAWRDQAESAIGEG